MNGRYLIVAGLGGALVGLLSAFGAYPESAELAVWSALALVWIVLGHRWLETDVFRHVALGGVIAGFLAADMQILFWDEYVANHPRIQEFLAQEEIEGAPRTGILLSGIFRGLLFGALVGLPLAWWKNRNAPVVADEEE